MLGFAQKLFLEKGGKSFWRASPKSEDTLQDLDEGAYIDSVLIEQLLQDHPEIDEKVAQLIYRLSAAAREGHLCLEYADPINLPPSLITHYSADHLNNPSFPTTPLCRFENLFYLQRYWVQETLFIQSLLRMIEFSPTLKIDALKVQERLDALQNDKKLLPEQAQAIFAASQQGLTIISGGPGTGKTYTAGLLFNILWSLVENPESCQTAFAAPTGKAAANLSGSLAKAFGKEVEVKTLHSLLGIGSHKDEEVVLSADLVLVDECSMIDANMMGKLLASIKPGARLILLGDKHQLPPVEAGSLFADMMAYLERIGRPATELKTCLRVELQEIIECADRINSGNSEGFVEMIQAGKVAHYPLPLEGSLFPYQQKLFSRVESLFPILKPDHATPSELLKLFDKFRLLSPLRKGPLGVDEINSYLFRQLMKKVPEGTEMVIPIMIAQNDKRLELSNGEVGVLVSKKGHQGVGDYALFPQKNSLETNPRQFPSLLLPRYEYAYCLSVHKSQGSEFERILLLMPTGSERFGREVLYTAVTRARKALEIWANIETLTQTISQQKTRMSGVLSRFLNHFQYRRGQ